MFRLKGLYVEYLRLLILRFLHFAFPSYFFFFGGGGAEELYSPTTIKTKIFLYEKYIFKIMYLLFINLLKSRGYYAYRQAYPQHSAFCLHNMCLFCIILTINIDFFMSGFHRLVFLMENTVICEMRTESLYVMQINLVFKGLIVNENSCMINLTFHPLILKFPQHEKNRSLVKEKGSKIASCCE